MSNGQSYNNCINIHGKIHQETKGYERENENDMDIWNKCIFFVALGENLFKNKLSMSEYECVCTCMCGGILNFHIQAGDRFFTNNYCPDVSLSILVQS